MRVVLPHPLIPVAKLAVQPVHYPQLADPHPVDALANHDLGMLAVANVAPKDAGAALPSNLIARPPNRGDAEGDRCRPAGVALARVARLPAGHCHVKPSRYDAEVGRGRLEIRKHYACLLPCAELGAPDGQ